MSDKENRIFLGILAGLAAGTVLGLLIAPDKGSVTRKKIFTSARDLSDRGMSFIDDLKDKVNRGYFSHHNGNGKKSSNA